MSVYNESPGNRNREAFVGFLFFVAMVVLLGVLLSSCGSSEYDADYHTLTVYDKEQSCGRGGCSYYLNCSMGRDRLHMVVPEDVYNTHHVGDMMPFGVITKTQDCSGNLPTVVGP